MITDETAYRLELYKNVVLDAMLFFTDKYINNIKADDKQVEADLLTFAQRCLEIDRANFSDPNALEAWETEHDLKLRRSDRGDMWPEKAQENADEIRQGLKEDGINAPK